MIFASPNTDSTDTGSSLYRQCGTYTSVNTASNGTSRWTTADNDTCRYTSNTVVVEVAKLIAELEQLEPYVPAFWEYVPPVAPRPERVELVPVFLPSFQPEGRDGNPRGPPEDFPC